MSNMFNTKNGFTLAEVLITLGIIGIVASMTIPSLIANYQKTQYLTGLKKAYAETTEALKLMANDHGCPDDLRCTGIFGSNVDNSTVGDEFTKYFKLAKNCGYNKYNKDDESTKCLSDSASNHFDGSGARRDMNDDYNAYYSFITADGFSMTMTSVGADCESNIISQPYLNLSKICGAVRIDVNGLKGPNNFGRDIFSFYITNLKGPALYPYGGSEMAAINGAWVNSSKIPKHCINSEPDGTTCPGRVMEEGWQMNY